MSSGIYKLTSPSGKCYIGQSVNLEKISESNIGNKKHLGKKIIQQFDKNMILIKEWDYNYQIVTKLNINHGNI